MPGTRKKRGVKPRKPIKAERTGGANSAHFIAGAAAGATVGRIVGSKLGGRKTNTSVTPAEKIRIMKAAVKDTPMRELRRQMVDNKRGAVNAGYRATERELQANASYRGTRFSLQENRNAQKLSEAAQRTRLAQKAHLADAQTASENLVKARKSARTIAEANIRSVRTSRERLKAERSRAGARRGSTIGLVAGLAAGWLAGEVTRKRK